MKKILVLATTVIAVGAALYLLREPQGEAQDSWRTGSMFVSAEAATFDPGPRLGSDFPGVRATYEGRSVTLIDEFAGPNGVIMIALRSIDWCPYCKTQLLQLQEHKPLFDANGIGLVAITYDAPALQAPFIAQHDITIPVLSDTDSLSFRTLGILNPEHPPGDEAHGIPYPGLLIVDREGEVAGKLFVEDPYLRVDSKEVLTFAKEALEVQSPF